MAKRDGWNAILFSAVECFWIQINHWTAKYSPWNAARRCELVVWKVAKDAEDGETWLHGCKTLTRCWKMAKRELVVEMLLNDGEMRTTRQLPDSTLRACWNITRDDRARLVWSNRDFFRILQIYLQYLLSYILKFLTCIHAGNPRVPPRVLRPKPCGGNNLLTGSDVVLK